MGLAYMYLHPFRLGAPARGLLGLALIGALLGASPVGCVFPDEFEAKDNGCEAPRFDLETRDAFCSGEFDSEPVVQVSDLTQAEGDRPLIRISGPWLTTVQGVGDGSEVRIQVFKRNARGLYVNYLGSTYPVPGVGGQITAAAVMGLEDDLDEPERASLALVHDRRVLSFVPLDPGLRQSPIYRLDRDAVFQQSGNRVALESQCANLANAPLDDNGNPLAFELANIEAFRSSEDRLRRYLMVSARCGVVIYGDATGLDTPPTALTELPLSALDVKVDQEHDRVLVASGLAGLRIAPLSPLVRTLDQRFDEVFQPRDGCGDGEPFVCTGASCMNPCSREPCACPGGDCAYPVCNDGDAAELAGGGVFDADAETIDPSEQATINVTRVEFNGDRIYYLNEYTDPSDPWDRVTWLVAGQIEGQGLNHKASIALASDDSQFERVSWQMVNLEDSLFAILRNTWNTTAGGEVGRTSRLGLVDAPEGVEPAPVLSVPLTAPVESIHADQGRLLVVQQDLIHAYRFSVEGDPKK